MQWIAAKLQLPEPDKTVLLWDRTDGPGFAHVGYWDPENSRFEVSYCSGLLSKDLGEVTHWMELPAGPGT